jgi:antitoxin CptB
LSRLAWQCRRGMRELDELLQRYLEQRYPRATDDERRAFQRLLDVQDTELQAYVLNHAEPCDPEMKSVVRILREHRA